MFAVVCFVGFVTLMDTGGLLVRRFYRGFRDQICCDSFSPDIALSSDESRRQNKEIQENPGDNSALITGVKGGGSSQIAMRERRAGNVCEMTWYRLEYLSLLI